ncbi:Rz-like spanin [Pseudomonas phage vB_PpuP-Konnatiik]
MGQTKYLIAAIALLLVLLAGSLYGLKATRETLAGTRVALESSQAALVVQQALTARIQTSVAKEKARADANRMELRNALKNNAAWSAAPVPPDVVGSLCKPPAQCSPAARTVR